MLYVVSYDLRKPGKDYVGLYEQLKASDAWAHYLTSTWFVFTSESSQDLYRRLSAHLDKNDSILILTFKGEYFGLLPKQAWDWIKQYAGY